jgi:hypothetical protein
MNRKITLFALFIIGFVFPLSKAYSQFDAKYSLQVGLSSMNIIGNNPATEPMWYVDGQGNHVYGGSLNGSYLGGMIKLIISMDSAEKLTIPVGFEYTLLDGMYNYPYVDTTNIYRQRYLNNYKFSADCFKIYLGANYVVKRFPIAHGKLYMGAEAVTTFITNVERKRDTYFVTYDSMTTHIDKKDNAVRLGGVFRLGINGKIINNFYADINCGVGIMNLIGRNNSRGELLTPTKNTPSYVETKESLVYTFQLVMSVQYRL